MRKFLIFASLPVISILQNKIRIFVNSLSHASYVMSVCCAEKSSSSKYEGVRCAARAGEGNVFGNLTTDNAIWLRVNEDLKMKFE